MMIRLIARVYSAWRRRRAAAELARRFHELDMEMKILESFREYKP
jgi:hypothetical protein